MDEPAPASQPPIFNLNAYSPAEIKEAVKKVGVKKTRMPALASFMLAMVAGGSVGLGALYYTIVASDAAMSFATVRVLGGLAFSLGLVLVLVGGAELFIECSRSSHQNTPRCPARRSTGNVNR
jgi:formate transporter